MLNAVQYGADPTGLEDSTVPLQKLHEKAALQGEPVYYPNGNYRFNGETLDLSAGVHFESIDGVRLFNDISEWNLFQHDDFGNFIGLIQNPLEKGEKELGGAPFSGGYILPAPEFTAELKRRVDFIGWWYNDFGLECTRLDSQANGWIGWYYWDWNHHNCDRIPMPGDKRDPYDPSRHPLLGFYKGDDPRVLDWITYWMLSYGINAVGLLSVITHPFDVPSFRFEEPVHKDHWLYELMEHTKNFKKMRYFMAPEVYYPPKAGVIPEHCRNNRAYIMEMIDKTYGRHPENIYTIRHNGVEYPTIFFKEEGAVMWTYDDITVDPVPSGTIALYEEISAKFRELGYPGVVILAGRDPVPYFEEHPEVLEKRGIVRYHASYGERDTFGDTLPEFVKNFHPPADDKHLIMPIVIDHLSHTPHQSAFTAGGHSPEVLRDYIRKALEFIRANGSYPAISCGNVSEWAELGPGLIPNMQDRFQYLEAVRDTVLV